MPSPHSLGGAGPAEFAPAVRLPGRRVHLALRRWSQRPSIDRMALDFRQSSFRHVTRVSLSPGFSAFSPFSALSAGSCPLALSSLGKPLTQGSPLNPSHLRWGCCMNYCGAPDAGGSQVQGVVRRGLGEQDRGCFEPDLRFSQAQDRASTPPQSFRPPDRFRMIPPLLMTMACATPGQWRRSCGPRGPSVSRHARGQCPPLS